MHSLIYPSSLPGCILSLAKLLAITRPGLGISINEAEVKKHPFQQELPQRVFYRDGSVGDW